MMIRMPNAEYVNKRSIKARGERDKEKDTDKNFSSIIKNSKEHLEENTAVQKKSKEKDDYSKENKTKYYEDYKLYSTFDYPISYIQLNENMIDESIVDEDAVSIDILLDSSDYELSKIEDKLNSKNDNFTKVKENKIDPSIEYKDEIEDERISKNESLSKVKEDNSENHDWNIDNIENKIDPSIEYRGGIEIKKISKNESFTKVKEDNSENHDWNIDNIENKIDPSIEYMDEIEIKKISKNESFAKVNEDENVKSKEQGLEESLQGNQMKYMETSMKSLGDEIKEYEEKEIPDLRKPDFPYKIEKIISESIKKKEDSIEIEINPKSMGKINLKFKYDENRIELSIISENKETQNIIKNSAHIIADILRDNEGKAAEVQINLNNYIEDSNDHEKNDESQNRRNRKKKKNKDNNEESFVHRLRLGLM